MKFSLSREQFLGPLQSVMGVVERRQTMPILANVLINARNNRLSLTGTDLEVEMMASTEANVAAAGDITVPGRKLLEIVRAFPEGASVALSREADKVVLRSGRSRFTLSSLPAADFPVIEDIQARQTWRVARSAVRRLIDKTHFAMAQQDVRYYLNGTLFESTGKTLRAVATDGHRLSLAEAELSEAVSAPQQVIVPRKGVLELQRILAGDGDLDLAVGSNHVRATIGDIRFTSKLIDGKFPDYGRVVPNNPPRVVTAARDTLRAALQRTAILSNEKYRGVRLTFAANQLTIQAHNPEQEEAEDQIEVGFSGEDLEIGFNVTYLLDALAAIDVDSIEIGLTDGNSSCVVRAPGDASVKFVVMPMRL
jgi:DNA polymerase-3 subunit beta